MSGIRWKLRYFHKGDEGALTLEQRLKNSEFDGYFVPELTSILISHARGHVLRLVPSLTRARI